MLYYVIMLCYVVLCYVSLTYLLYYVVIDTSMLAVTTDTTSVAPEFHVTTDSELRKTSVASEFHVTTASVVPSELVMTAVEHYVRPDNTITSVMPAVKPPTQSASETSDCRIIYEWNMSKDFRGYAGVFNYQ